eukprot:365420-Chlamydomonas_euryale.AAC.8
MAKSAASKVLQAKRCRQRRCRRKALRQKRCWQSATGKIPTWPLLEAKELICDFAEEKKIWSVFFFLFFLRLAKLASYCVCALANFVFSTAMNRLICVHQAALVGCVYRGWESWCAATGRESGCAATGRESWCAATGQESGCAETGRESGCADRNSVDSCGDNGMICRSRQRAAQHSAPCIAAVPLRLSGRKTCNKPTSPRPGRVWPGKLPFSASGEEPSGLALPNTFAHQHRLLLRRHPELAGIPASSPCWSCHPTLLELPPCWQTLLESPLAAPAGAATLSCHPVGRPCRITLLVDAAGTATRQGEHRVLLATFWAMGQDFALKVLSPPAPDRCASGRNTQAPGWLAD